MRITTDTLLEEIASTPASHHVECIRCHPDCAAAVRALAPDLPIFTHDKYLQGEIMLVRRRGPHPGESPDACDGIAYT